MFSIFFKQQLLEVLLECLLQIDQSHTVVYNKFCDRLEHEMMPYIVSHEDESAVGPADSDAHKVAFIELKLPYMAIIEQQMEQEEMQKA